MLIGFSAVILRGEPPFFRLSMMNSRPVCILFPRPTKQLTTLPEINQSDICILSAVRMLTNQITDISSASCFDVTSDRLHRDTCFVCNSDWLCCHSTHSIGIPVYSLIFPTMTEFHVTSYSSVRSIYLVLTRSRKYL